MGDLWRTLLASAMSVATTLAGVWLKDRMHEHQAARDVESGAAWRARVEVQLALLTECNHVQLRHELIHDAEKAIANGCISTAERQSWWESYNAYEQLGKNGYIADYWLRIQALPIREV